jgi:hypothetical protein
VFFITGYLLGSPGKIYIFWLASNGAISYAAIMATLRQTGIGMDKKFSWNVGAFVN